MNNIHFTINDYNSIDAVDSFLAHMNINYPNFSDWFKTHYKEPRTDRNIIQIYIDNKLVGVSLTKEDPLESKICSFYILNEYRSLGLGTLLMKQTLNTFHMRNDILLTVADDTLVNISSFLSRNLFFLSETKSDLYKEGKKELFFLRK